jgi:hypothetical protein
MTTTRRTRTFAKVGSAAGGLGLAALAVLGFSNAAFSAQSSNEDNNWAADGSSTVELAVDDAVDAPLFSFGLDGAVRPQSQATQLTQYDGLLTDIPANLNASDNTLCDGARSVDVTYTGKQAADVRMYVDPGSATGDLDEHTLVTIKRDGVAFATDVKLSDLPTDYAGAQASRWAIPTDANGAAKASTYEVTLKTDSANPAAGTVEGVKFIWEAQQA